MKILMKNILIELGKMVGRWGVPFIFISGNYVGGFDGLEEKLKDAGAIINNQQQQQHLQTWMALAELITQPN